jgi:hypothetical protein
MADISDVRESLAQIIGAILYPAGVPVAVNPPSPLVGACVRVYAGWPERDALDVDLRAGIVSVSVYAPNKGRDTTRYPVSDTVLSTGSTTLTWVISGTTATLGGTVASPQNAGLLVDGHAYLYGVHPNDTLSTIAAALAALVNVDQPATAIGPAVSIPDSRKIIGRVGSVGTSLREVGREKVQVWITTWAPSDALRSATAKAFQPVLKNTPRFPLPDGSIAALFPDGTVDEDGQGKALLYKRHSLFWVEYAETIPGTPAQILTFVENVTPVAFIGGPAIAPTITTVS